MTSVLKAQKANAKGRREEDDSDSEMEETRNRQRVLLVSSRGITYRLRHLMKDIEALLPHVKKDSKLDSKSHLHLLPELADLHGCNNALYFEVRRHQDVYLWAAKMPNGPSVKFHVQNVHTMHELNLTGNCLRGSRGVVSFDAGFEGSEWGRLVKELLTHVFGVPALARRAKPFVDHVLTFSLVDSRVWFRNYQMVENEGGDMSLLEIGPRFVLTPIRIFEGAFGGATVYSNPEFITPAAVRAAQHRENRYRYRERKEGREEREKRKRRRERGEDQLSVGKVFK